MRTEGDIGMDWCFHLTDCQVLTGKRVLSTTTTGNNEAERGRRRIILYLATEVRESARDPCWIVLLHARLFIP